MKRLLRNLTVAAIAAAGLTASTAFAEDATPAKTATMSNDLRIKFIDQQQSDLLGSKIIGASIQNNAKDTIGSIADIVYEASTVRAFIVSVGGFLGVGSKYVAVDPSVVHFVTDKNGKTTVSINTDKDQLKAAPEYRYLSERKDAKQ